uniref:HDC18813 n=1 Tax=Drosophila melanogaster TaxID=7227 RepID=Q6IID2_DROME|nr:TPA_inf: HDC18813 [Drosophila melanogaster]
MLLLLLLLLVLQLQLQLSPLLLLLPLLLCIRGASEPRADFHSSKLPHPRTLNPSCHQRLADPETNCPHANCGKQKRTNGTPSRRHQIGPPMQQQQQQQQQVATVAATCNMPLTQTDTAKEKKKWDAK